MNKDHLDYITTRSSANADFLPYSTNRTAPYLLWDDAVSHASSSRTCCSCTCCRAFTVAFIVFLMVSVFTIVGFVIYLGILTNSVEELSIEEDLFDGSMRITEGDRFSLALRDKKSPEFSIKALTYETLINKVYRKSILSDAYIRAQVVGFQNGSLIVYFRLHLDRRKLQGQGVQIVYEVMHDEVQKEHSVAFKTVRVDPDQLNISGMSSSQKINFVDYFNDESEDLDSTQRQTSETISAEKLSTPQVTVEKNVSDVTSKSSEHHRQQNTHQIDYGRWEPFTTATTKLEEANPPVVETKHIPSQGSRGSISEISFDWEPDEGIAAFFPSTTRATTKRIGVGFTLTGENDNSREFGSRVLPPSSEEMIFRMDSPALVINRPTANSPSEWAPISPASVTEPNSKEILASRDDPKLGFGLRLPSQSDPSAPQDAISPNPNSKNLLLRNQSSHAVIVRLPPGSQPRANGTRRSSALQRRQEEWQRHRQIRLLRIKEEEREKNNTESIPDIEEHLPIARVVAADRVDTNIFKDLVPKMERRFTRDPKRMDNGTNAPTNKTKYIASISMKASSGSETIFLRENLTSQSLFPVDPITITSVVTSIAEEYAVTSAPSTNQISTASSVIYNAQTINENDYPAFPELLRLSAKSTELPLRENGDDSAASTKRIPVTELFETIEVDYEDTFQDELSSLNISGNEYNVTEDEIHSVDIRNRSAVSNSVLFNSDEFYEESNEDNNKIHSTESMELFVDKSTTETSRCNSPTLFRCSSGECVSIFGRCNRMKDCADNSDEQNCTCADYIRANVINSTLCDGIVDCWDFSDENQCEWCRPDMFVCPNARMCIEYYQLCDGIADCPRGEDERACVTIAPNITAAEFGSYWRSGLVMIRKEGKWGKLCMQNFDNFVSETQVAVSDLSRVICQTMGYRDFEEGKEIQESFREGRSEKESYYEPQYNNYSSNARSLAIDFFSTPCVSKEVISVRCKDFGCGRRHQSVQSRARIVGGINSTPGSWPWQAAVYKEGNFMCGASLISDQWLLSAAHCFHQSIDHYWTVRLGVLRRGSRSPYERTHQLSHILIHPNYMASNFINDIVLLRMEEPVPFSEYVRPICLPTAEETQASIFKKQTCSVVGWGQVDEDGDYLPDTLQEVKLPLISAINCRTYTTALTSYARVNQNMFCAGMKRGGRDACLGDSGGPLMCQQSDGRWTLTGITSNGFGCARAARPGIYTKVVNYKNWISKIIDGPLSRPIQSSCAGHRCPFGKCIRRRQICDGFVDCSDESDEKDCMWPRSVET